MANQRKPAPGKPARAANPKVKKPVVITQSVTIDFTELHAALDDVIVDLKNAQKKLPGVYAIGDILTAALTLKLLSDCQSSMTLQF